MNIDTAALRILVDKTEAINFVKNYPTSSTPYPVDTFITAGVPAGGSVGATGGGSIYDNTTPGALPLPAQAVGQELRLLQVEVSDSMYGGFVLMDRLLSTSGIDLSTTTTQNINTIALPTRATGGAGCEAFLIVNNQVTTVPAGAVATISYTNQAGVAGKVGSLIMTGGTLRAQTIQKFALEPGDSVRSIETITMSAAGTLAGGNWGVIIAKRLCSVSAPIGIFKVGGAALGFPKVEPDACLNLWMVAAIGLSGMAVDFQIASVPI